MAVDDYKIADSMGRTDKFFRHSMAYKYEDELFETVLTDIECVIDAKSLNGVLSLGLYKDFEVYIHTNDEDIMEAFNNIILNFKEEVNEGSMYIWEG